MQSKKSRTDLSFPSPSNPNQYSPLAPEETEQRQSRASAAARWCDDGRGAMACLDFEKWGVDLGGEQGSFSSGVEELRWARRAA